MKKNKTKKLIIMSLSLIFCLTTAYSAFQVVISLKSKGNVIKTPEKCFTVTANGDGTGTITNYDETCGTKVVIPSQINNLKITKIADAEYDGPSTTYSKSFTKKKITSLVLPNTIEEIGIAAFDNNEIKTLIIPNSVKKIDDSAFRHNKIKNLTLPNGYIELGIGTFNDNSLPEENAFIYKRNLDGTLDKTVITSYAGVKGENINIPQTVKTLNKWSFRSIYNSRLKSITIPDNVEKIEKEAFQWNRFLTKVEIGNGTKTIEKDAFSYNGDLEEVTIGSGIQTIGDSVFTSCPNLKTITINKKENSVTGAPWGSNATINWIG